MSGQTQSKLGTSLYHKKYQFPVTSLMKVEAGDMAQWVKSACHQAGYGGYGDGQPTLASCLLTATGTLCHTSK